MAFPGSLHLLYVVILLREKIQFLDMICELFDLLLRFRDDLITNIFIDIDGNPANHFLIERKFFFGLKIFIARQMQLGIVLAPLLLALRAQAKLVRQLVAILDLYPSSLSLSSSALLKGCIYSL